MITKVRVNEKTKTINMNTLHIGIQYYIYVGTVYVNIPTSGTFAQTVPTNKVNKVQAEITV